MTREASRPGKSDVRLRILEAARELAAEKGPGNISIEAVAARAGLSKGGVLYHFRTKSELLTALVARHVSHTRELVEQHLRNCPTSSNALAVALIAAYRSDDETPVPPASGVLAAIAENPALLDPLNDHHAEMLARLRQERGDVDLATIVFLALEGMKALHLFGVDVLGPEQEECVLTRMRELLDREA